MAISATARLTHLSFFITLLFLIALFTPSTAATSSDGSDFLAELLTLQSQSNSGVIRLNDYVITRVIKSTKSRRPFSLLIFFDAVQLHEKPELHLKPLRTEFALVASSFISNNADDPYSRSKLFFCDVEFKESQSTFTQFGVNALPHIRFIPAAANSLKDDTHQMDAGDFSRFAESMAKFIESKTKLTVGPINRPMRFDQTYQRNVSDVRDEVQVLNDSMIAISHESADLNNNNNDERNIESNRVENNGGESGEMIGSNVGGGGSGNRLMNWQNARLPHRSTSCPG